MFPLSLVKTKTFHERRALLVVAENTPIRALFVTTASLERGGETVSSRVNALNIEVSLQLPFMLRDEEVCFLIRSFREIVLVLYFGAVTRLRGRVLPKEAVNP